MSAAERCLVALTTIVIVLIEVPLSIFADWGNRVRRATTGAAQWAVFAAARASPLSVVTLAEMRIGCGACKLMSLRGRSRRESTHDRVYADLHAQHECPN